MTGTYRVGVTADSLRPDGSPVFGDVGLDQLREAGLEWDVMPSATADGLTPAILDGYDAVLSFGHLPFSRVLVEEAPRLKHVARFGAGYDGIDLDGLADAGVVVTNAPLGARRPLALSALTLLLALSHRLVENHRAAATGRWEDLGLYRGMGVAGPRSPSWASVGWGPTSRVCWLPSGSGWSRTSARGFTSARWPWASRCCRWRGWRRSRTTSC